MTIEKTDPILVTIEGLRGRWLRYEQADRYGNYWVLPLHGQNSDGTWRPSYEYGWRAIHGDRMKEAKPMKPKRHYTKRKKKGDD